jgi:hypothetical protein
VLNKPSSFFFIVFFYLLISFSLYLVGHVITLMMTETSEKIDACLCTHGKGMQMFLVCLLSLMIFFHGPNVA